jgi:E3 ubiquitin-protein ligase RAD18
MEECVNVFQAQRADLLALARRIAQEGPAGSMKGAEMNGRPPKRRRIQRDNEPLTSSEMPVRATRSKSRMALQTSQESREHSVVEDSEDEGSQYVDEGFNSPAKHLSSEPNDGLVSCPMCGKRMKEEAVFTHLDQCDGGAESSGQQADRVEPKDTRSGSVAYSVPSPTRGRQRLGALNYSLLSETALRRKLGEIGIPSYGPKSLMQRRHMEWMNFWNASCDSTNPKTKKELLRELDVWERTQGRQIANAQGPSGVMAKDFDAEGWTKTNKDDFADLIRSARGEAHKPTQSEANEEADQNRPVEEPQVREPNADADSRSPSNGFVDLTSQAKPSLEQQRSQGSQIGGVLA